MCTLDSLLLIFFRFDWALTRAAHMGKKVSNALEYHGPSILGTILVL